MKNKTHKQSRARGSSTHRSPSVTRRRLTTQLRSTRRPQGLRMKSMVYITGPPQNLTGTGRVAQIVKVSRNKNKYVVRLNYSGRPLVVKKEHLRKATAVEKRSDPKLHSRESPIAPVYLESLESSN